MASAIFITDAHGIILWFNDAFTRLSGYAALEAVGRTPSLLNSGRHDRRYYSFLWETILAGKVWQGEVIDRHKTGRLYAVDEIITRLFDQLGVATHFRKIVAQPGAPVHDRTASGDASRAVSAWRFIRKTACAWTS